MAGGFTKLFSSIVTSSIWCQDDVVLRVWIAMLATCDSDGVVEGSVPGFASMSRVTNEQMERAIEVLSCPDEYSRTKDKDGRRIEAIDGGWQIVNYRAYRDKGQAKEGSRAPYMRNRRASKVPVDRVTECNALHQTVTSGTEAEAEAEAEADKEKEVPPTPLETAPPSAKAEKPPHVKKLKTTELKPDSVEAFQAAWETIPPSVVRWDATVRRDVEEAVAKGSRAVAERNFQAIVDARIATPRTLYVALYAYITEGEGPKKGFVQHCATFYGPQKRTYLEWLDRAREIESERYGVSA